MINKPYIKRIICHAKFMIQGKIKRIICYVKFIIKGTNIQFKMNFSRFIYLDALCSYILTLTKQELQAKKNDILSEIIFRINEISALQKGGYWYITRGDRVFISYMKKLKFFIKTSKESEIPELISHAKAKSEDKIKVVFLAQESFVWPSFESVYHAMMHDKRYIVRLIYIPFTHINKDESIDYYKIYKEQMGLPILRHNEYNLSYDSPDIVFFAKPYDCIPMQYYITEVEKVVRRCVYIPYGIRTTGGGVYTKYAYRLPLHYSAWKIIADSKTHMEDAKKFNNKSSTNMYPVGNPRVDAIRRPIGDQEVPIKWRKKINNRKTIMYNTHHSILPGEGFGTFLKYSEKLLDYFYNQSDIVLLWRPHPLLKKSLLNSSLISEEKIISLFKLASFSDNIILDEAPTYLQAFYTSDALITDGTSFLKEYIFTEKPILYTVKHDSECYVNDPKLLDVYYVANNFDDIIKFCDDVKKGTDNKRDARLEKMKSSFFGIDTSVAETIKKDFYNMIIKEEFENANII